jgi:exonuclease VII large subunit
MEPGLITGELRREAIEKKRQRISVVKTTRAKGPRTARRPGMVDKGKRDLDPEVENTIVKLQAENKRLKESLETEIQERRNDLDSADARIRNRWKAKVEKREERIRQLTSADKDVRAAFEEMRKMMRQFGDMSKGKRGRLKLF